MEAKQIYHALKSIVDPIHSHNDQMVAIAKWIEAEFVYKPDRKIEKAAPEMFKTLDFISNMEEDRGRSGCTYGDTEYDSESAAYGYNQCLDHIKSIVNKAIKKATE